MKRIAAMFLFCGLVAGCGGKDKEKTFTYGDPTTPTSGQAAAVAATSASLSGVLDYQSNPSAGSAGSVMGLGLSGMNLLAGDTYSALPMLPPAERALAVAKAQMARAQAMSTVDGSCNAMITDTTATWDCKWLDADGSAVTMTGKVTASVDTVTWNVDMTMTGSSATTDMTMTFAYSGSITVTDTTVVGRSDLDFSMTATADNKTVKVGFQFTSVIDLTYQAEPFCVTGGTLEYKLVWTDKPQGSEDQLKDAGLKFFWTGCGQIKVAYSVG